MNIASGTDQLGFSPQIQMDPALQLTQGGLRDILCIWQELAGDRPMPARADFHPRRFLPHLPDIALVDIQREPLRVRYRLVGTKITSAVRRELTGRWYDTLYPPHIMAQVEQVFSWIVTHRRPLRTTGMALFFDRRMYSYEVLNLPLSAGGEEVDMVLAAMKFYLADAPPASGS